MKKRYVIEIGMGVDQHGHQGDPMGAAIKATRGVRLKSLRDVSEDILIVNATIIVSFDL